MTKRPGIIVDRDGTLIDFVRDEELGAVVSAFHPSHVRFFAGVVEGLLLLQEAGFVLAMATNQPGAAKGQVSLDAIHRTNQTVVDRLAEQGVRIEAVEVCLHHTEGGPGGDVSLVQRCSCRKPHPGMLLALADKLALDPGKSWMIGDASVDVLAARGAGMQAGLIFDLGRCEMCPVKTGFEEIPLIRPDASAPRMDALAQQILNPLGRRA
ncbi:MAG TPA: HAD-IIIA family hydrolase [Polyangium sp.]|nr:HAD-IIIA family hydrolase [Polyangium sp.]